MTFIDFENFLLTEECFDNHDVSYIDEDGNQHYIEQTDFISYVGTVARLLSESRTMKVEQIETLLFVKGTVHAFYNQKNGASFDVHTDPVDVFIECLAGKKIMEVDGKEVVLEKGDTVLIPSGTPHRALNYEKALMLSHGIHDSETLNRIR